jgi:hypothetical protein
MPAWAYISMCARYFLRTYHSVQILCMFEWSLGLLLGTSIDDANPRGWSRSATRPTSLNGTRISRTAIQTSWTCFGIHLETFELEGMLMERFTKRRVRGEWFDFGEVDPVKEVRRAVEQIQARY